MSPLSVRRVTRINISVRFPVGTDGPEMVSGGKVKR
jgi:hypothetical protein